MNDTEAQEKEKTKQARRDLGISCFFKKLAGLPKQKFMMASSDDLDLQSKRAVLYWVAVNYQQNYYELAGDWNQYESDKLLYLKNYIGITLFGVPEGENSIDENGAYVFESKNAELVNKIFDKVKEHGTQPKDNSVLCTVIYSCMYLEDNIPSQEVIAPEELVFLRPVFKVCKSESDSWFIDTEARVYKTWKDYLTGTNLPSCTLIVPKDGEYKANLRETWSESHSSVYVEKYRKSGNKLTKVLDCSSAIVGLGAVGVIAAAPFVPVIGATTVAAFSIAGAVSTLWSGGRSINELVDRKAHDQDLLHKEAIPAWLGAAGSALGGVSSAGSYFLSRAVRSGTSIARSARYTHDIFAVGNVAINVAGASYSSYSIFRSYKENEKVSVRDLVYLSAHIFIVCNAVVNLRLANTIIQSDQQAFLQEYEESLRSNRHRKEFRRLVRNTAADTLSEAKRNEQIIKTLNNISDKDEFYACLTRNRKLIATSGSSVSFKDGNVKINDEVLMNPTEFAAMSKDSIQTLLTTQPGTSTQVPSAQAATSTSQPMLSQNALKGGLRVLRDFCVQKSIPTAEPQIHNYSGVIYDLRNHPDYLLIFQKILSTGFRVAELYAQGKAAEVKDLILPEVTRFVWRYIKNMTRDWAPGILDNPYLSVPLQEKLKEFVYKSCDDIESRVEEIVRYFAEYQAQKADLQTPEFSEVPPTKKLPDLDLCDVELIYFSNLAQLPEEEIWIYIFETLQSTSSSFTKLPTPSKEMVALCNSELEEFFEKHPVKKNFEPNSLAKDLGDILSDLKDFDKKDVIFYKLVAISHNISLGIRSDGELEKSILIDVMKSIWLVVLLSFRHYAPNVIISDPKHEYYVISIVISIYWHWTRNPKEWSNLYYRYQHIFKK